MKPFQWTIIFWLAAAVYQGLADTGECANIWPRSALTRVDVFAFMFRTLELLFLKTDMSGTVASKSSIKSALF